MTKIARMYGKLPACDFCEETASYDGKTCFGPWAYMCEEHFQVNGTGQLGLGIGQRLVLVTETA